MTNNNETETTTMDAATEESNRRRRIDRRGREMALQERGARLQIMTTDHAAGGWNLRRAVHHMELLAANRGGDAAATLLRWRAWAERATS